MNSVKTEASFARRAPNPLGQGRKMLTRSKETNPIADSRVGERPRGRVDLLSDPLQPHKRLDLISRQRHRVRRLPLRPSDPFAP